MTTRLLSPVSAAYNLGRIENDQEQMAAFFRAGASALDRRGNPVHIIDRGAESIPRYTWERTTPAGTSVLDRLAWNDARDTWEPSAQPDSSYAGLVRAKGLYLVTEALAGFLRQSGSTYPLAPIDGPPRWSVSALSASAVFSEEASSDRNVANINNVWRSGAAAPWAFVVQPHRHDGRWQVSYASSVGGPGTSEMVKESDALRFDDDAYDVLWAQLDGERPPTTGSGRRGRAAITRVSTDQLPPRISITGRGRFPEHTPSQQPIMYYGWQYPGENTEVVFSRLLASHSLSAVMPAWDASAVAPDSRGPHFAVWVATEVLQGFPCFQFTIGATEVTRCDPMHVVAPDGRPGLAYVAEKNSRPTSSRGRLLTVTPVD